jgi:DNA-binding NtrC family response regulator
MESLLEVVAWRHMADGVRVLIVDDDAEIRRVLTAVLVETGADVAEAASATEGMARLGREDFDVALLDIQMPDHSGLDVLRWARAVALDTELIVLTGHADVETAVEAMRLGACDFVTKPCRNAELRQAVTQAAETRALRRKNVALTEVITRRDGLPTIVGRSPEIHEVLAVIGRVAGSDSPVLIQGESGTGKELVARAIHAHGRRASRPFLAVNCGAIAETLLDSELFGHARGSFTGAVADRRGLFEQAGDGTMFLDEIGETSAALQVKLLRVLEESEVRPVGAARVVSVAARIIAATNVELEREVTGGRFRQDLFYRLSVIVIVVPPLRERRSDIPLLISRFLESACTRAGRRIEIAQDAIEALSSYAWPGNVRELENTVERLVLFSRATVIEVGDLPAAIRSRGPVLEEGLFTDLPTLDELERRYLLHVLKAVEGNRSRAASVMGVDRRTLYRMAERFGLELPD